MKYTNKTNLPMIIYRMVEDLMGNYPKHDSHTFSVTGLLKGTKEFILGRRHDEEIEVDIQRLMSLCMGLAVHRALENAAYGYECLAEKRFRLDLATWDKSLDGYWLSGQPDFYEPTTGTLLDYKITKVANYDKATTLVEKEWLYQTLAYTTMLKREGYRVEHIKVEAILKDYSPVKAEVISGHPKDQTMEIDYSQYINDEAMNQEMREYLCKQAHRALEMSVLADDAIPPCTPKERFEDEKFAVMKEGAKKAFRTFETQEEAEEWFKANPREGYSIVHRAGDPKKCRKFCFCTEFCNYYKELMASKVIKGGLEDVGQIF